MTLSFEIMGLPGSFFSMNCTAVHHCAGEKPKVNGVVIALARIWDSYGLVARILKWVMWRPEGLEDVLLESFLKPC